MANRAGDPNPAPAASLRSFFRNLLRAFVPRTYPELAAQPASASALHLAGVAFLVSLLLTPLLYMDHERTITATCAYFERVLPEELYFEDNEAHYDGEQPVVHVEEVRGQRHVVIVDTTGQTTKVPDEYDEGMVITPKTIVHKMLTREGSTKTVEDPIPDTAGRIAARQFYLDALEMRKWPEIALGVGNLFLSIALRLFGPAALAAAISFALETTRKAGRLPFRTCFNIAAYAATPIAFATASMVLVPTAWQFYLLLGIPLVLFMLLTTLGVQACRRAREARPKARKAT